VALLELMKTLQEKAERQRKEENSLLEGIALLSDTKTAEAAAKLLAAEKHAYSFDGYLYQLTKLQSVMAAGVPAEIALEGVDCCLDEQLIILAYRRAQNRRKQ